jgi:Holliday junction resolvase RusA-like endonuclease
MTLVRHRGVYMEVPDPPASVRFTVYGIPAPAGSKRGFVQAGHVRIVDDSVRSRPWKALVSDAALKETGGRGPLFRGPLTLEVWFVMPRPKGHFGAGEKLRPSAPEYPAVKPDATKLLRAVEDALNGIVWKDDSQVVVQHVYKLYGEPARCEIIVIPRGER